ncbi:hypothetical protein Tco_1091935 [Tanacetum coccineum]|uniref:Uncharacterized protein n=1 Tax=Tanacetum coccineum TaxID=301880 RepID=A0ABQ5IAC0_9ASTR
MDSRGNENLLQSVKTILLVLKKNAKCIKMPMSVEEFMEKELLEKTQKQNKEEFISVLKNKKEEMEEMGEDVRVQNVVDEEDVFEEENGIATNGMAG